jgi:hypothetical protein
MESIEDIYRLAAHSDSVRGYLIQLEMRPVELRALKSAPSSGCLVERQIRINVIEYQAKNPAVRFKGERYEPAT